MATMPEIIERRVAIGTRGQRDDGELGVERKVASKVTSWRSKHCVRTCYIDVVDKTIITGSLTLIKLINISLRVKKKY
jgi:hypothetical protein